MSNSAADFYPGYVPNTDKWDQLFSGKVDAQNGTLTSPLVTDQMTVGFDPSQPRHVATKAYVDATASAGGGIPDAPANGSAYLRMNNSWVPMPSAIPGSVTGDLTVGGKLSVSGTTTSSIAGNLLVGLTTDSGYMLDVNGAARVLGPILADGAYVAVVAPSGAYGYMTISRDMGQAALFAGLTNGSNRWYIVPGNGTQETGGNAGSDFAIQSFTDSGAYIADVLQIKRSTGDVLIATTTDAGYKLDVNATAGGARLTVTSGTSAFRINANTATPALTGPVIPVFDITGKDTAKVAQSIISYGGGASGGGLLQFQHAGGTAAAPTSIEANAMLGQISAVGNVSGTLTPAATISFINPTASPWSAGNVSAAITFSTTIPLLGIAEVMRINENGTVLIGSTTSTGGLLSVSGGISCTALYNTGFITTSFSTKTGTAYSAVNDSTLVLNPTGTFTLTLPSASLFPGRIMSLRLIAAFAVNSATANVVPLAGGTATTAIMPATAGKFCTLISDGTNWHIMIAN